MSKFMEGLIHVPSGAKIFCDMGCKPGVAFSENMGPSGNVKVKAANIKTSDSVHKIPELTKWSSPKRPYGSFPPDMRLCFVKYLNRCEKVTQRNQIVSVKLLVTDCFRLT